MSKAKVTISGFVGRKELKYTPTGMAILEFSIPTEKRWTDKNTQEKKSKTSWHNLKAFGRTGETIDQYVEVGQGLIVFGDLEVEEWETDGQKRSKTIINVNEFDFPPVKRDQSNAPAQQSNQQQAPQQSQQAPQQFQDDSDLPF